MAALVQESLPADLSTNINNRNHEEESEDAFPDSGNSSRPLFDLSLIQGNTRSSRNGGPASVATTADLASEVGSVMMNAKEAFMKSFTFRLQEDATIDSINWGFGITLGPPKTTKKGFLRNNSRIPITSIDENSIFALSRIREGDYLKSINGRQIGPSFTPERALSKMKESLEKDGYLCVATKNREEGSDDILVHATVIKPSPDMTLEDLGMTVWVWGYLCIKSFKSKSIFKTTALKEADNIVSVNEIVCQNVDPEGFASIIRQLPREITITVLRRKQRSSGNFS
ncbi:expressed unknown protein [Seminavis robusta]|uniref:PDZ domain-containing protein n=1 Tax=Seminavis robusta TaxID=568900 RepID=A0A9N8HGE3_9STRA|nr:expressed unknown protein [Seminavis robusta]|eukprot:Sro480_g151450.1 n/a (285) ;mRNA; f:46539-47393